MQKRIQIGEVEPLAYKAMAGVQSYLSQTGLSKTLQELIKIRASQINGCAFCIDMHTKDALKYGETPQRLFLVGAWRETENIFTAEETAVLALTEEVTLIHEKGLTDATYQGVRQFFNENQLAQIIMAVVTINMWNRIAIASHMPIV